MRKEARITEDVRRAVGAPDMATTHPNNPMRAVSDAARSFYRR